MTKTIDTDSNRPLGAAQPSDTEINADLAVRRLDTALTSSTVRQENGASSRTILLAIAALIAVAFLAYGRTLTTYFLADDFGEVAYVSRIVDGRWDLFWSNWTGNFMQIPGMAVYRPLLLVSLLCDYIVWKTNSVGYYLTNLLIYSADVALIFLVTLRLTKSWTPRRSVLTGFAAAALFAVNPLHCESVSWVVGRVDAACCMFSLSSIYCFLRFVDGRRNGWLAGSLVAYFCGLLFKEMAIGVPILTTAISLMMVRNKSDWKEAALNVIPVWATTALYFVVRFLALGTLLGGYTGAIGDGQGASAFTRWLDLHTYERVIFPFAVSLFHPGNALALTTKVVYIACLTLLSLRVIRRDIPWRLAFVIAVWLFSAAVPIYKLWGIGMDLEGARFCFFLTVPLSLLLPALLFAPEREAKDSSILICATVLFLMLGLVGYKTTLHSNANWVHAGREVRSVLKSAVNVAQEHEGKKIVVLGIPKFKAGAHMIYNGATFKTMLEPPFTKAKLSERFLTFDPIFYGPDQYVNADRFRETVRKPDVAAAFVWNSKSKSFEPAKLNTNAGAGSPVNLPTTNSLDPWQYDFVEAQCVVTPLWKESPLKVTWRDADGNEVSQTAERMVSNATPNQRFTVRVPVSHYWRWFTSGAISDIQLQAPAGMKILSARLVSAQALRPRCLYERATEDGAGVYAVDGQSRLHVDATQVPGCTTLLFESSKPNYFFDQIAEKQQPECLYSTMTRPGGRFNGAIPDSFLPENQYCELRVRALNANNEPIGEYSEPVIVFRK